MCGGVAVAWRWRGRGVHVACETSLVEAEWKILLGRT